MSSESKRESSAKGKGALSFEPPRGMRDFYPAEMAWRKRLFEAFGQAAEQHGFEAYDACVVERLELLERKSGEEVSAQIYAFEDKSGRKLALRPEMTPTLARMVAARHGELHFPLKWSAIAQCFRYERMMRGRKREHYQWNLDIIGEPGVAAEVEVLATAARALEALGLPASAYRIHVNNRALLSELLLRLEIEEHHHAAVFLALDKRGKIPDSEIAALLAAEGVPADRIAKSFELMALESLDQAARLVGDSSPALRRLRELFELAGEYQIADRLLFDISVIRGLAYYTDIVFEAFDSERKFRAIFGGGRYDNLLTSIGGAETPAVGLGFGDVVILEVLKEQLGTGAALPRNGVALGFMQEEQRRPAMRLAAALRQSGRKVDLAIQPQRPRNFFSRAGQGNCSHAVYIGPDDVTAGTAQIKDLTTRDAETIRLV